MNRHKIRNTELSSRMLELGESKRVIAIGEFLREHGLLNEYWFAQKYGYWIDLERENYEYEKNAQSHQASGCKRMVLS